MAGVWAMLRGDEQRERREEYVATLMRSARRLEPEDVVKGTDLLIDRAKGQYPPMPSEWLGCCLEVAQRRRETTSELQPRPADRGKPAPPWVGRLWMAVLYARIEERGGHVPDTYAGELEVVKRLGLRAEHGINTHPAYDPGRVADALEAVQAFWREHGLGADVRLMTPAVRRMDEAA